MTVQNLLVELCVEELPPKALKKLGESFASELTQQLQGMGLAAPDSVCTGFASPRRLGVHITHVALKAQDRRIQQKLMPVSVGLDAQGKPTAALLKKLTALGADVHQANLDNVLSQLKKEHDGKTDVLFYDSLVNGATLDTGLQKALEETLSKLPIPKVMSYQLAHHCALPGWSSVHFVRPAHGLVALHGSTIVPVQILGLRAGHTTQGHRFEAAQTPVTLMHADDYESVMLRDGAVIASFAKRRAAIQEQLAQAALRVGQGVRPIEDEALLDEVCALVERPNVLVCAFEKDFLEVPQECLILTMKANQKYFPLLDAQGRLTHQFLVVSNISPADPSAVVQGNERVVRPRLADAKFFFDQDRKKTLDSRVPALDKVVYHNKLGTQGQRMERVSVLAQRIAHLLGLEERHVQEAQHAARLAKADLLTDMVGEFPELQGTMGRYYALNDGLSETLADAIEDHYKPRFAGDELPRNMTGVILALADKLETLVGMFGIGNLPTGDKDPYALRRHALGVVRLLIEKNLNISLQDLLHSAVPVFADKIKADTVHHLSDFIFDRLAASLRESGYSAHEVEAVLCLRVPHLAQVPQRLQAVRAFASLPQAQALAAANKRIGNILKKSDGVLPDVDAHVSEILLQEPAEKSLFTTMNQVLPQAQTLLNQGNYTDSLQTLAGLRDAVDTFFEQVMVNAEQTDLRLNRLALLKILYEAMNRIADLSKLAV